MVQGRLQFKCRGQTFDKCQYKACTIPHSLSLDMNFCQSLEILCLNFLKSVEFESEGGERERERERDIRVKREEKKEQTKRKCLSCLQTWEMPLSALCCLGVMQISSGCLSRQNRDQNRQWSNHYKAGWRSAATGKTDIKQWNVCLGVHPSSMESYT